MKWSLKMKYETKIFIFSRNGRFCQTFLTKNVYFYRYYQIFFQNTMNNIRKNKKVVNFILLSNNNLNLRFQQ